MLFSIPSSRMPPSELAKATVYSRRRDESFFLWSFWLEVVGKRLKSRCWVSRAWAGVLVLIWVMRLGILLSFILLFPLPLATDMLNVFKQYYFYKYTDRFKSLFSIVVSNNR